MFDFNFQLCPLDCLVLSSSKRFCIGVSTCPCNILQQRHRSALRRLSSRVHKPAFKNLAVLLRHQKIWVALLQPVQILLPSDHFFLFVISSHLDFSIEIGSCQVSLGCPFGGFGKCLLKTFPPCFNSYTAFSLQIVCVKFRGRGCWHGVSDIIYIKNDYDLPQNASL